MIAVAVLPPGYRLTGSRVLVELRPQSGAIYIPPAFVGRGKTVRAVVVATGPAVSLDVGSDVLIARPEGTLPLYALVDESDVLAALTPD
jgi:hypothetical protein